jgi:hypothetical protein
MSRFFVSAAVGTLALALSGPAWAGSHGHSPSHSSGGSYTFAAHGSLSHNYAISKPYHLQYGTKFSHGYYFYGPNHHFWTSTYWSSRYGCNCYWCPSACCWYYWCAPRYCYYPISYIAIAPPYAVAAPAVAATPGGPLPPAGPMSPAGPPVP